MKCHPLFFAFLIPTMTLVGSGSSSRNSSVYVELDYGDVWYGPGYYYGIWFDTQDDYLEWRYAHLDYPSNGPYYSYYYPIFFYYSNGYDYDHHHHGHDGGHHHGDGHHGDGWHGGGHGGGGHGGGGHGGGGHGGGGHR